MITLEKIGTGEGDDYNIGRLLDYNYFNNYYKMLEIALKSKK